MNYLKLLIVFYILFELERKLREKKTIHSDLISTFEFPSFIPYRLFVCISERLLFWKCCCDLLLLTHKWSGFIHPLPQKTCFTSLLHVYFVKSITFAEKTDSDRKNNKKQTKKISTCLLAHCSSYVKLQDLVLWNRSTRRKEKKNT